MTSWFRMVALAAVACATMAAAETSVSFPPAAHLADAIGSFTLHSGPVRDGTWNSTSVSLNFTIRTGVPFRTVTGVGVNATLVEADPTVGAPGWRAWLDPNGTPLAGTRAQVSYGIFVQQLNPYPIYRAQSRAVVFQDRFGADTLPCGWRSDLAASPPVLFGHCLAGQAPGAPLPVEFVGKEGWAQGKASHYRASSGQSSTVDAWFVSTTSLPALVRVEEQLPGGARERTETTLERYGPQVPVPKPAPTDAPLPAVALAPTDRLGPPDPPGQVYPLRTAWREAAAYRAPTDPRPSFGDWVAAHPEWSVTAAQSWDHDEGDNRQYGWRLDVQDGTASLRVTVGHHVADLVVAPGLPGTALPRSDQFILYWNQVAPTAVDLHAKLPDPQSVARAWQAYSGASDPGLHWGFVRPGCGATSSAPCAGLVWAGTVDLTYLATDPIQADARTAPTVRIMNGTALAVDGAGHPVEAWTMSAQESKAAHLAAVVGQRPHDAGRQGGGAPPSGLPFVVTVGAAVAAVGLFAAAAYGSLPTTLGLFSRIFPDRLTAHPRCALLLEAVAVSPGIHYKELLRRVGGGTGTRQHIATLVRAGRLVAHRSGRYQCYFLGGGLERGAPAAFAAVKSGGARAILRAVCEAPGCNARQAALHAGLSPAAAHAHLQRLRAAGLVDARRAGASLALFPTTRTSQFAGSP
ncbi:MAG: winged helix-turn-helix transcriptional regulator [Thermoplasmatota archaeon]